MGVLLTNQRMERMEWIHQFIYMDAQDSQDKNKKILFILTIHVSYFVAI
jgi:hypothetical protein